MKYKCKHCGRIFTQKCAHNCNTGFRKRHLDWDIVELDVADTIRFRALQGVVVEDLIPLFGGSMTLLEVSDKLKRTLDIADIERKKRFEESKVTIYQ